MYVTTGLKERNNRKKQINAIIDHNEKQAQAMRKPYKPSNWCKDMVRAAIRATDSKGNFKPGSSFTNQLRNHQNLPKVPNHAKQDLRDKGFKIK